MSWPAQWPVGVGAQPAVASVLGAAPAVLNPAPAVAPPAGTQYTPEQWAQVQQQNWNQWAQWQQQYQQWHQQYGAEYQKSMSAMSAGQAQPGYPNVAVPPPLPVEANKPPLPQDDPPPPASFTPAVQGYSTVPQPAPYRPPQPQPPLPQPSRAQPIPPLVGQQQRDIPSLMSQQCEPPPLIGLNNRDNQNAPWQKRQNERQNNPQNNPRFGGGGGGMKRGMDQSPQDMFDTKRPNNRQDWQAQPPAAPAPPPKTNKENLEELSEAERKFDKQFADWEDQFNKWKEQNVDHPDKEQYRQYEKKWEQWRAQLLDRREQMKRKRLALMNEAKPPVPTVASASGYAQPPPKFTAPVPQMLPKNDNLEPYAKPPPNLNDEPLTFAQTNRLPMVIEMSEDTGDFLKPSTGGGIPGLDLVLDGGPRDPEETPNEFVEKHPQGPDFEAISKGINSILGDQKLLNMLSMVKQNQSIPADKPVPEFNEMSGHSQDDFSNQSGGGYNQREFVANFDDQTRSSFTHNEFDSGPGRNQPQQQQQQGRFEEGQFNQGARRNDSFDNRRPFGQGGQGKFGSNLERQFSSNSDKPFGSDSFGPNSSRFSERQFSGPNAGGQFGGPNSGGQFAGPNSEEQFGGPNSQGKFGPNTGGQFGGPKSGRQLSGPNTGGQFGGPNTGGQFGGPKSGRQFGGPNSGGQFSGPNSGGQFGGPNSKFGGPNSGQFGRQGGSNNADMDNDRPFGGPNRFPPGPGRGPRNDEGFGDRGSGFEPRNPNEFRGPRNFRGGNDEQFGPRFGAGLEGDRFGNDGPGCGPPSRDRFAGPPQRGPTGDRFDNNRQFGGPNRGQYEDEYGDQYVGDYNDDYNEYNEGDNFGARDDEGFDEPWKEQQDFQEPMEEPAGVKPIEENLPPPVEKEPEVLLQPATVIDYDHKSLKNTDVEVLVVPIHMFDYRHKPLSRIPFPQRPKWLAEVVRNIREFDPPLVRSYEPPRRYPRDPLPPVPLDTWRNRGGFNEYEDVRNRWSPPPIHDRRGGNRSSYEERKPYDDRKSYDEPKYRRDEKRPLRFVDENFDNFDDFDDDDIEDLPEVEFDKNDDFAGPDKFEEKTVFANPTNPNFNKPEEKHLPVKTATLIEDLISPPGRYKRPPRIVIILRGPPGSGKTFLAKLIKDKEVENGGSAPRILSLDDYFMVEQEREVVEDGKRVEIKEMVYEYEAEMEEMYRNSLIRSFKKTINDGYFPFIIVDNVNDKIKYFGEMWSYAKQNGFQVYICQLDLDVQLCTKRNIHNRTEAEIEACVKNWDPTPAHHPVLDATSLIQSGSIAEVEMEEVNSPESNGEEEEDGSEDQVARSKWDNFDCSVLNLAKLDGLSKPLRPSSRTMEEYLQMESQWSPVKFTKPGQKRVRWADLEEQKEQERMRAIGFVVGQTNWDRMMDPTKGSSALTQTKFIERARRF